MRSRWSALALFVRREKAKQSLCRRKVGGVGCRIVVVGDWGVSDDDFITSLTWPWPALRRCLPPWQPCPPLPCHCVGPPAASHRWLRLASLPIFRCPTSSSYQGSLLNQARMTLRAQNRSLAVNVNRDEYPYIGA